MLPHINTRLKASYSYITFGLLFPVLLFEAYPMQIPFERGIEIVNSRGYELIGDVSLTQAEANLQVSEKPMKEFLRLSEATRPEGGLIRIYSDMDARVLFIFLDSEEGQLIVCRFR